jgi:amino acid transporter
VSWLKKGYTMKKSRYLGLAMVLSVLIAAGINILYGLAVYSLHPLQSDLSSSQIPALYLADKVLGPGQELLIGIAFLVATITTFVPAFLAASRHMRALGDDGYIPHSISNFSWVFTLAAILILALGNANFLVEITDFLVLISLGIITLSAVWLRSGFPLSRQNAMPIVVGLGCFVAGAAIYFIDSGVVVFGVVAVVLTYLIFDITELGFLGTNLFLAVFNLVCVVLLSMLSVGSNLVGPFLGTLGVQSSAAVSVLSYLLLMISIMLTVNMLVDVKVLGRTTPVPLG